MKFRGPKKKKAKIVKVTANESRLSVYIAYTAKWVLSQSCSFYFRLIG
jgi:hypothetical protein